MREHFLIITAVLMLLVASCAVSNDDRSSLAAVNRVDTVESNQPTEFYAMVEGFYADNCSETGDIVQRIQGRPSGFRLCVHTQRIII